MQIKKEPLYRALTKKIAKNIELNVYPIGSLIPTEMEISKQENLSRYTVRLALSKLEQMGLIRRTPHVGTKVLAKPKANDFTRKISSFNDLDSFAKTNKREILEIVELVCCRNLAKKLSLIPGEKYIKFTMIRQGNRINDLPVAWTDEYANREWQDLIDDAKTHPDLLMIDLIENRYREKCVKILQTIESAIIPKRISDALCVEENSSCLRIVRHYKNKKDVTILTTDSFLPSDRYVFNIEIKKE